MHVRKPFARTVKYAGGSGWQAIRRRILERDAHLCQLRLSGCTLVAQVIDHRLNRARGGSDDESNLQASCKPCNETKRRVEAVLGRKR